MTPEQQAQAMATKLQAMKEIGKEVMEIGVPLTLAIGNGSDAETLIPNMIKGAGHIKEMEGVIRGIEALQATLLEPQP